MSRMVTVYTETTLREGGSTRGPNNAIGQEYLPAGDYRAIVQCAGEEFVEGKYRNYWWVYLETGTAWGDGWVTAVHITTPGVDNDQPIDGVRQQKTIFAVD